jgi:hypothetical protein
MADPLTRLAAAAESEPFYLASLLAAFARSEGLDDNGLAARLGCAIGELPVLKLCRAPRRDPAGRCEDIARLAEHFHLDAFALTEAVKRAWVMQAMSDAGDGLLMAARDREKESKP